MRIGELLVHEGVISSDQLAAALRQQVVYGGRLGTNLIELGYAAVDEIAHGLARLHRVPAALERHLHRHDPAVLELVSPQLAAAHTAFPVAFSLAGQARRLVLCLRDPYDREAIAKLGQVARMDVVPCVAPELVLYYWLERCYRIPRSRRFAHARPGKASPLPRTATERLAAAEPDGSIDVDLGGVDEELEMPAEMQLVELDDRSVERDHSQYALDSKSTGTLLERARGEPPTRSEGSRPDLAVAASGGPTDVRGDAAALAATMAAAAARRTRPPVAEGPRMSADEALDAIARADHRSGVSDAVVAFMRGAFGGGLILLAKEELALGYKGFGGSFDDASVESIVFPLSVPSMFQKPFETGKTFRAPPPEGGGAVQDRFFKLFPLEENPAEVVVVPVVIRDRIVCLMYAHARNGGALNNRAVDQLDALGKATAEAFVRLIKGAKRREMD